jgi:hypothetical protein
VFFRRKSVCAEHLLEVSILLYVHLKQ